MLAQITQPVTDAAGSVDPATLVLAAAITAVAWGALVALSGLEGWVLLTSLSPWVRGFILGAALVVAGGAVLLFWVMAVPQEHLAARVGLGVAGGVGGLLLARLAVGIFWRTWRLRIFLAGAVLTTGVYLLTVALAAAESGDNAGDIAEAIGQSFVRIGQDGGWSPQWEAIAKAAAAFVLGGGLYLLAYCLLFPLLWLVRNAALVAAGAALLALPELRAALVAFADETITAEALWAQVTQHQTWFAVAGGAAVVLVGYAMWIQRFAGKFRHLVRKVVTAERGTFRLPSLAYHATGATLETLGRMATLRRDDVEHCRLFEKPQDDDKRDARG
ncbi:MAG: hypothetical protein KGY99_02485 [Phycisphaerae bacterium]|nr:hypothetical protein [Phycisphaerae bacterium]